MRRRKLSEKADPAANAPIKGRVEWKGTKMSLRDILTGWKTQLQASRRVDSRKRRVLNSFFQLNKARTKWLTGKFGETRSDDRDDWGVKASIPPCASNVDLRVDDASISLRQPNHGTSLSFKPFYSTAFVGLRTYYFAFSCKNFLLLSNIFLNLDHFFERWHQTVKASSHHVFVSESVSKCSA